MKWWLWNLEGNLDDGATASTSVPVQVLGLDSGMAGITTGQSYVCTVSEFGEAKCWGGKFHGEIGSGVPGFKSTPKNVAGLDHRLVIISAGSHHTCAVTDSAHVMCWGANDSGQLGAGVSGDSFVPIPVVSP